MSTKTVATMFAATACASTMGLFAVEVPAQAAPRTPLPLAPTNCDWTMQSNEIDVSQDNGLVVHLAYDLTDTKDKAHTSRRMETPGQDRSPEESSRAPIS
jgi:hypothetical protein